LFVFVFTVYSPGVGNIEFFELVSRCWMWVQVLKLLGFLILFMLGVETCGWQTHDSNCKLCSLTVMRNGFSQVIFLLICKELRIICVFKSLFCVCVRAFVTKEQWRMVSTSDSVKHCLHSYFYDIKFKILSALFHLKLGCFLFKLQRTVRF